MKVLITGGLGGVGFHVTRRFLAAGHQVRVLELEGPLPKERLALLPQSPEVLWGDVTKPEDVRRAVEGVDAVVHLAAIIPPKADEVEGLAHKINVGGTKTVVEALKSTGRKIPLVFTSSIAVFGDTRGKEGLRHPDRDKPNPHTPYEKSKYESETLVRNSGLDFLVLRLTATPHLTRSAMKMKDAFMLPYDSKIEFCHVEDTATAILHGVERFEKVKGKVFVIAGGPGEQMRYNEFLGRAMGRMGLPCPPASKFSKGLSHLDWYDTRDSEAALEYQSRTYDNFLDELYADIPKPAQWLMRYFVGPAFGWLIVRMM
ncbi:MAG: NAD(P)-dependent oxidoreductase [Bdellovibrionota bacterium]